MLLMCSPDARMDGDDRNLGRRRMTAVAHSGMHRRLRSGTPLATGRAEDVQLGEVKLLMTSACSGGQQGRRIGEGNGRRRTSRQRGALSKEARRGAGEGSEVETGCAREARGLGLYRAQTRRSGVARTPRRRRRP
jgi:hypothetical protein